MCSWSGSQPDNSVQYINLIAELLVLMIPYIHIFEKKKNLSHRYSPDQIYKEAASHVIQVWRHKRWNTYLNYGI